ncbi:Tyrosine-protein kinase [Trema orientale]|uniref:Tyrosine-protein kinase n=1 Tax=Trema orientale TaxID=63057 RepID=A0A2P5CPT5_TREOI|nr:Tyrosine-protein kinase [Trema orientale]
MAMVAASLPAAATVMCSARTSKTTPKRERKQGRAFGDFGHLAWVVGKDVEYLKTGIGKGLKWANEALRISQVSKAIDDVVWLRHLEDPNASPQPPPSWPQPSYPELSGVDLFMADLKALETYAAYYYCLSKTWSKPLPEVYDQQQVADYFNCRPHVVAFRLVEVFSSFATAAIRIRTSRMKKSLGSSVDKDVDGSISQYNFGVSQDYQYASYMPLLAGAVGQSLSTRPDIIGTEIAKALSELHDQIPPFPRAAAMKIIEEELGSPVESFFSYISEEPVAAASFGQVYSATTLDGSSVAVKVQRPNMRHVVVRDIYILRLGLGILKKIAKRKSDPRLYADELGRGLVGELDYNLEAANASEFLKAHSSFSFMRVPKVLQHLSQKRVLTMEWIVGESPTDLLSVSTRSSADNGFTYSERQRFDAKRRLLDMVNKGVEATLIQLLETGLLHADPHPGNLRYTSSGQLGFLDFGLLCRMEKKHQFAMLAAIVHIVDGDWASLVYALDEMDIVRPGTNIRRVIMDLEYALGEVKFRDGIPDLNFSRVLGKIFSIAVKYHFRMPPYFTLLLRSLASFEGLALAADKNFKTFEAAYPYVFQKLLTENSAATNKILFSVVLNKKKEFQWQKLALFLRAGATRKGLLRITSRSETSIDYLPIRSNSVFDLANLVLRLLPSKDGAVLRRLLMTANGASLIQAVVSKEAKVFRQHCCRVIADILYLWVFKALGKDVTTTRSGSQVILAIATDNRELSSSSRLSTPIYDYDSILRDRRLKVIFSNVLKSARRNPVLMLRFYWASFVMFVTALALACHRVVVSLSEAYFGPVSFACKQYAIST